MFPNKDSKEIVNKKSMIGPSPSLNQGKKFKKYQNKIERNLEKKAILLSGKEGFSDMTDNANSLTAKTNAIINNNDYSSQQQTIDNLRQEYQNTLKEYQDLVAKLSGNINGYVDRVNPNNPYLNKTIRFTTGHICYVTNQGVVKYIPSMEIWNSVNIPKNYIDINIPWQDNYSTPGTIIDTNPPLISGTFMQMGQSVGGEGANVFVSELLPSNISPTYKDCYAANSNNDNMSFIGGSPPPSSNVTIQNGNFSQTVIPNNSYRYLTWDTTTVPGWNFNCVFVNNSTAWGYPMPYPNGNQCACIQGTQQLWTNIWLYFVAGTTYTLSFSACGRPGYNGANTINVGLEGNTFYTFTAVVNEWQIYTTTFTAETTGGQRLSFIGTITSGDNSTAIQGVTLNATSSPSSGTYSYDDCKIAAITNGYRYFGLQNVNTSTGKGYCAVSNSEPSVTQFGNSQVPSKMVALWSTNTAGQSGNTATLSNTGSLQVLNSSGQAVYSTPATNANPANYLGCYGDNPSRAMSTAWTGGSQQYDNSQCQQIAQQNNYQYYGLQNSTSGTTAQCFLSNDITQTMKYGPATNCTQVSDSSWSGGGWSNAVYNTSLPQSNYFLILQDDGNMVIYRGTSPSDNQGTIWSTGTNGQQQSANPDVVATKGKFGKNWMSQGSALAAGDFIGSDDGKMALVMQSDGNLVLYTYQMETNCQKMSDGNMGGGVGANAVYDLGMTSITGNIGKLGFVDSNSNLYTYSSTNQQYTNSYKKMDSVNTWGNDIPGAAYGGATLESCQTSCNNNVDCAGFIFQKSGDVCWPKTSGMFPFGGPIGMNTDTDLYVRGRQPSSPPLGVAQNTNNIDTITYQNYINKGEVGSQYGLANATSTEKQQLEQLQSRMNLLTSQINSLTGKFQSGSSMAEQQSYANNTGIDDYANNIKTTNKKIIGVAGQTSGNIQNILKDSDIVVLQKNYDYLFWSILAAGTVLLAMNVAKKQ